MSKSHINIIRRMTGGGGSDSIPVLSMPVLWPNGKSPKNPNWPAVGVVGTPVLDEGETGPGMLYIWTGPGGHRDRRILELKKSFLIHLRTR